MADLICRWRNGTAKTVVELANTLPHEKMPVDQFREKMKFCYGGDFFRTPYQLACQLALYCEADDGLYYPRFDHDINEVEAEEYLEFWIARYFVPNPYVRKDGFQNIECPTYFLKSLCDYVKKHPNCEYKDAYYESFGETAKNNDDIIRNYINNYSKVLNFSKDGILSLTGQSLEERFAFMDRNDKKAFFFNFDFSEKKETVDGETKKKKTPTLPSPAQIIYYGVPGCGKSKKIQDITGNVDEYYKTRVVFHPEYTSADFIGQIFPCVGENGHGIDYRFKAGPFTEILRRAYLNSQKQFYLVIEEINRGNAAAIFSDVFQLLDRLKDGKTDSVGGNTYKNGWSQYFVDNADVNAYIRKEEVFLNEIDDNNRDAIHLGVEPSSDKDSAGCYKSIKIKDCNGSEINFSANTAIRLPPNLSIYATMNTSDQNVFTLDNAFQRRFDMEMIPNELDTSDADSKVQYETVIGGAAEKSTGVSWGVFRDWINGKISNANTLLSTEDRCLGGWFVTGDSITDKKKFAEKVLKYLWDDAFKHNREIFKLKSLSEIVAKFVETNGSDAFKEIFGEVPEVKDAV